MLSNYNKTSYFSLRVTEPIPPSCFIEMCYKWTQFPYSLCFRTVHYLRLRSNSTVQVGLVLGKRKSSEQARS